MWLGIDFGTTNSAIAFSDGKRVHTFKVDAQSPDLLPSLIYITKNFEDYVGSAARDVYLEKNTDKPSLFKKVTVGTIRLDVGGESGFKQIEQNVVVMIDVLSPGRLLRSIKTGLRTFEYDGSVIFGRNYSVEELIAILLKQLVTVGEQLVGEPITHVVMGRPVKFSDDPAIDRRAEERIVAAARLVGIEQVKFLPEPIAAAYSYHRDFVRPTNTFIFDFGGGTLDLTVAELGGADPKILATEGVLIGGDDLDKRLFEALLPHFGKGAMLTFDRMDGEAIARPIPEHIWEALLDWQTVEELKQSDAMEMIEEAGLAGNSDNPQGMQALYELIHRNLYYKLMRGVEQLKVELSQKATATLTFHEKSIHIDDLFTRERFARLINNEVAHISRAIDRVVTDSGLTFAAIEKVVPTGGSAQIPLFKQMLAEKFTAASFANKAERDMTGVVQGLAIYGADLDAAQDDSMPLIRGRLLERIKAARVRLPAQGGERVHSAEISHAVVGINPRGDVEMRGYRSGKPLPDAPPVKLRDGVFLSKAGHVLLGTTLTKFVIATLGDIEAMVNGRVPHQLKLDRLNGEEYIFVDKWDRANPKPYIILVSRWGNARSFQRRFVDKPLRDEGQWKLDSRGKSDPPSKLVPTTRASYLLLLTERGRAARVRVSQISVRGSRVLKLRSAETVHAISLDNMTQALVFFADGGAERIYLSDVPQAGKAGIAGKQIFRREMIVGVLGVTAELQKARGLTSKGRLVDLALAEAMTVGGRVNVVGLHSAETLIKVW